MNKLPFAIFFCFMLVSQLYSQNLQSEIQSLENDLRKFEYQKVYEKGQFLLTESYITKEDSIRIYQFMIDALFALSDTSTAKNMVEDLLSCCPDFKPDPRIVSPKIIDFINNIKSKIAEPSEIPKEPEVMSQPAIVQTYPAPPRFSYLLSSIVFPGSAHLMTGREKKGIIFSAVSSLLIGGIVYSAIRAEEKREDYFSAGRNGDFPHLYDEYDTAYKIRNYLLVSYAVFNLYAFYDFYRGETRKHDISLRLSPSGKSFTVKLSKAL
ncbi:MAG: hypothetical protein P8184_12800 [Calditrichia bacterium]